MSSRRRRSSLLCNQSPKPSPPHTLSRRPLARSHARTLTYAHVWAHSRACSQQVVSAGGAASGSYQGLGCLFVCLFVCPGWMSCSASARLAGTSQRRGRRCLYVQNNRDKQVRVLVPLPRQCNASATPVQPDCHASATPRQKRGPTVGFSRCKSAHTAHCDTWQRARTRGDTERSTLLL